MHARKILWLTFGLALAGFVLLLLSLLREDETPSTSVMSEPLPVQASEEKSRQVWVMTYTRALAAGQRLAMSDLTWRPIPQQQADGLVAYVVKDSMKPESLKGAVLRRSVTARDAVNPFELLKPGDSGFLAVQLREGMRAYSIQLEKHEAQAGLVAPGDFIDIYGTVERIENSDGDRIYQLERAYTAASGVRVLAVDQRVVEDFSSKETEEKSKQKRLIVTTELTPKQATQVALADIQGKVTIAIRHPEDIARPLPVTRMTDLFPENRTTRSGGAAMLMRGIDVEIQGGIE
ncbi:Uncharacterised protein [BD1-7 clade bacterium]|uniref:Flp pilus assembly protein RcpC/CpaB domain-containing protein n=1 Tax=BD1-7 clade bacterium TaxID=2029982 RepID=A0A5S9Q8X4_9GAMM|nr:Uncharacterised protein [BD1-7 clade bacterium]CAA0114051.1 Uncharacterised protein [BD1-7 clade bacterium]